MLPWDDDVDLCVSIDDRSRLQSIVNKELSSEPYSIVVMQMHKRQNNDKLFFSWCPQAGRYPWRFPFIDVFYHDKNSTHIWLLSEPRFCSVRREDVFPFVLRPFGRLWLFGPRQPMAHFESRKMKSIETGCFFQGYSKKYERKISKHVQRANCEHLKSIYPYVERKCTQTECIEHLKLGTNNLFHKVSFNDVYRTNLYSEVYSRHRQC